VAKILKVLVNRKLVKAIKTVTGIQKVYMLYELEPGTVTPTTHRRISTLFLSLLLNCYISAPPSPS
jgi:hypothetical protein